MENDKKIKIENYHFKEIILILLILSSELATYEEDDLVSFSEDIEGRIDVLFTANFLKSLDKRFNITIETINDMELIKTSVIKLYQPQWHKKLAGINTEIKSLSKKVLEIFQIRYTDPHQYCDENMNIDW